MKLLPLFREKMILFVDENKSFTLAILFVLFTILLIMVLQYFGLSLNTPYATDHYVINLPIIASPGKTYEATLRIKDDTSVDVSEGDDSILIRSNEALDGFNNKRVIGFEVYQEKNKFFSKSSLKITTSGGDTRGDRINRIPIQINSIDSIIQIFIGIFLGFPFLELLGTFIQVVDFNVFVNKKTS